MLILYTIIIKVGADKPDNEVSEPSSSDSSSEHSVCPSAGSESPDLLDLLLLLLLLLLLSSLLLLYERLNILIAWCWLILQIIKK